MSQKARSHNTILSQLHWLPVLSGPHTR